jgi:mRNA interferase HigB
MRILTWTTVEEFIRKHANSERSLRAWRTQIQSRDYPSSDAIKRTFSYASVINSQRVVFNIKGNDYRLVATIHYDKQRLFVRGVFTHEEYDSINVETICTAGGPP